MKGLLRTTLGSVLPRSPREAGLRRTGRVSSAAEQSGRWEGVVLAAGGSWRSGGEQFHQSGEGERDGSVSCGGKRREEVVVGSAGKVLKRSAA